MFADAKARGFDAIVTLDVDQLSDPDHCTALKASGLHHISLKQAKNVKGRTGVARVIASFIVAMPYILEDLAGTSFQAVVPVSLLGAGGRHEVIDPRRDSKAFPYWPR